MNLKSNRIDGFFYGLFMDEGLLRSLGVEPVNPRHAVLENYQLRIGKRATLAPRSNSRVYGMVFALTAGHFDVLYSAPGLTQYQPETVTVQHMDGGSLPARVYILPGAPEACDSNAEYASQLREVLARLGFPTDYIESIA